MNSKLPLSSTRVLRALELNCTYVPLVPKHLRAKWPRPERSHPLPKVFFLNDTDNRQQRQRSVFHRYYTININFVKRFYALYDCTWRYFNKCTECRPSQFGSSRAHCSIHKTANAQCSRQGSTFVLWPSSDSPVIFYYVLYLGYWLNHIWLEINADVISKKLKK